MNDTTASSIETLEAELSDDQVEAFLRANPEFFDGKTALLSALAIPHETGASISLIERQIVALRAENQKLQTQLGTLVDNARSNEDLQQHTNRLLLALLAADNLVQLNDITAQHLKQAFSVDARILVSQTVDADQGFDAQQAKQTLARQLAGDKPFCGLLKDAEAEFLFGDQAEKAGSAAIIPLRQDQELIGLLAIASEDKNYYRDNMSTDVLSFIGQVLAVLISARIA